jgi:hypothetical protein
MGGGLGLTIGSAIITIAVLFKLWQRWSWAVEEEQFCREFARRTEGVLLPRKRPYCLWWEPTVTLSRENRPVRMRLQSLSGERTHLSVIIFTLRFHTAPPPARIRLVFRGSAVQMESRSDTWYRTVTPWERMRLRYTGDAAFDDRIVAYCTSPAAWQRLMSAEVRQCLLRLEADLQAFGTSPVGSPDDGVWPMRQWDLRPEMQDRSVEFRLRLLPRRPPPVEQLVGFYEAACRTHQVLDRVSLSPVGQAASPHVPAAISASTARPISSSCPRGSARALRSCGWVIWRPVPPSGVCDCPALPSAAPPASGT